ncbi:S8 family peptidase [Nitrosospira sp. Is2]|uniref:S8 family peptidase n=1 Tax=Nitrosospira sp. Is2 TaxID=3080532 RepID=UPI0029545CB2|nr:S8 family serine peptidase [Nitrosospira sp. Is2]WON73703.1 S8 family serine peptidase [Nitrosospira sp. Is2]
MVPTQLIRLSALMERTSGGTEISIGLIDGPVFTQHSELAAAHMRKIAAPNQASCTRNQSMACLHGTFIAGILSAKRTSPAPAICPDCTLLVRPIFSEASAGQEHMPAATPGELATAILDCIHAGARVINLSVALAQPSTRGEWMLDQALDQALHRGVLIVAAAGNQGTLGTSPITRHPWVIPVVACDSRGRPLNESNLGGSIGRRGLSAPGDGITSLGSDGNFISLSGTSVAVPFITGAIALLWSQFPSLNAAQIKLALTHCSSTRRASVVPPLLDAEAAYQILLGSRAWQRSA